MTKYETVKNQTTEEYFENNKFSVDAFNKKYALHESESYVQALWRVCSEIASVEPKEEDRIYWRDRWFDEIYNDWWHPAGSIMQGAGSGKNISLANCTTVSLGRKSDEEWDNLESIIKNTAYTVAKCAAYRQGLGVDFNRLRPRGLKVENSANESTGPVHWMSFIDNIANYVGQKGRIPAMLFSLHCSHPSIEEFITVKSDFTKIQNANISVQCSDNFYESVLKDEDWKLEFKIPAVKKGDKVYIDEHSITKSCKKDDIGWYYVAKKDRKEEVYEKTIKSKYLLELIAKNMRAFAEPGIQNIDIAERLSNSNYVDRPILSTNACVTADTDILTEDGFQRIEFLENKKTKIWNGEEWSDVTVKQTGSNEEILKICFSNGETLKCTKYHKFPILKNYSGDFTFKKAEDLKIGDKIIKCSFPIIEVGEHHTNAYSQGLYSADGLKNSKIIWLYDKKILLKDRLDGKQIGQTYTTCRNIDRATFCLNFEPRSKDFVPLMWDLPSKLEWLSGFLDGDGCSLKEGGVQAVSIDYEFLLNIKRLINTCGSDAKVIHASDEGWRYLPDNSSPDSTKKYFCKKTWRICIGAKEMQFLYSIGLNCSRIKSDFSPNRSAQQYVKVNKISESDIAEKVYCFNEPKRHMGIFNGVLTGQCSEQFLDREGLCILSSINCEMFSIEQNKYKTELEKIGASVNRFLDNVIEYEIQNHTYATPHQLDALKDLRRTGAGYTNISAWLFKQNICYGSKEANSKMEDFTKWYNYGLYKSSIQLGKEKGSFLAFDKEKIKQAPFIKRMTKLGLVFDYLRNVTCSSIAPTGSLSLMFRRSVLSYGIEPGFYIYFWKRTRISGKYTYYFCVPRVVREIYKEKGFPIPINSDTIEDTWDGEKGRPVAEFIEKHKEDVGVNFMSSTEVKAIDKLDLMAQVMKWVDSSISVTYMLPENSGWEEVYDFILEGWKRGVKSLAAFPDKKMYGIVSFIPFKDLAFKLKKEGVELHYGYNFSESELNELNASKEEITINPSNSPKRPKILDADIHIANVKSEKYVVAVGLLNGQPYEVFGGKANGFDIKQKCQGKLIKHKKGQYGLEIENIEIDDFSKHFTPEEQTIFRLASTNLRHGIPIEFVVEQMQKSTDDMFSLPSAVARVLKKYIKDGQKVVGKTCPSCGSDQLSYQEGCVTCQSCGWSKCS